MRESSIPVYVLSTEDFSQHRDSQPDFVCQWYKANGFTAKPSQKLLVPDASGYLHHVVFGMDFKEGVRAIGSLPGQLPEGRYCLVLPDALADLRQAMSLYWLLACYRFGEYKKVDKRRVQLELDTLEETLSQQVHAINMVRDLVQRPANDMTPEELIGVMRKLTQEHRGHFKEIVGDDLLQANFPLVHAVGRASGHAPRIGIAHWGEEGPLITIVGKGVTFDTGGLDIKPSSNMLLMKKDMGGAAHALALSYLILKQKWPCRLQLIIPAVENAISGDAYRPSDVLLARSGQSVEVGNTDAEGRLILADALALASEAKPDLLIDFATLTGAARVAMGPDVPCYFTHSDKIAALLATERKTHDEKVWRLPLVASYRRFLQSGIADLHSTGSQPYGGAILAALFLEHFADVEHWVHFDVFAWNSQARLGQPQGGEAQGLLSAFDLVQQWLISH